MKADMLADLAHLFTLEAEDAHERQDDAEADRLFGIAEELFGKALSLPPEPMKEGVS